MEEFQALVLKSQPYRETSAILTLLTDRQGVVRAVAKGARRPKGIAPAALEPFAWIEGTLSLKAPDALGTLGAVTLREGWDYLRADPTRWAFAALGIEVLGRLASASPPDETLWREGCEYLRQLEHAAGPGSLTALFLLRLLHAAGFPPHLLEKWRADAPPDAVYYDFASGALRAARADQPAATAYRLPGSVVGALRPALVEPPPLDAGWTIPSTVGRAALRWLVRVWEDHLGQPLASARYLESMVLKNSE
jgi:DNA repair protein RecO